MRPYFKDLTVEEEVGGNIVSREIRLVEVVNGLRPSDAVIVDPSDSIESGQTVEFGKGSQP